MIKYKLVITQENEETREVMVEETFLDPVAMIEKVREFVRKNRK